MFHLGNLRSKNPKNIIFSYININSIRNKFDNLCGIVDILSVAKIKLDSSFPNAQFSLHGFHEPLRLNVNYQSGRLLVDIKTSLPSKILRNFKIHISNEMILFEVNLRKEKWLFLSFIHLRHKGINIS